MTWNRFFWQPWVSCLNFFSLHRNVLLARQHEDGSGNLGKNILVLESVEVQMYAEGRGEFETEINRKMPSVRKALVASILDTSPPTSLPDCAQVVTWKCTVKTITNMRFWESIIENGWFRGWPRRTRGTSGARSRWQNSSFCTCRQLHKQLRWEPTIKCRLSCHLVWTWQRMLSQIGNQRGPAFSTHARNWLFNSRFLKVWSLGSLGSIQEQNFVF